METMNICGFLQIIIILICFLRKLNASKSDGNLSSGNQFGNPVVIDSNSNSTLQRLKGSADIQPNKLDDGDDFKRKTKKYKDLEKDKNDLDLLDREYQYDDDLDNYINENAEITYSNGLNPEFVHDKLMLNMKNGSDKLDLQPREKRQIDSSQDVSFGKKINKKRRSKYADVLENSDIDDGNTQINSRRRIPVNKALISKHSIDAKAKRKEKARVDKIYHDKVEEIMKFLVPNYMTTNFMHDEMKRMKRQGAMGDQLWALVEHLEKPEFADLKNNVLKCFWKVADKYKMNLPKDIYKNGVPNKLAIDPFVDPYVYG